MKKASRVLTIVLSLVFVLSCMMTFVSAADNATATKDGITATLSTSKDAYTNEEVDVKLTLKNDSDAAIANVTAKITGISLNVKSGEATATGLLLPKGEEVVANNVVYSAASTPSGGTTPPPTGDTGVSLWVGLMTVSGIALMAFLASNKNSRGVCAALALVLVLGLAVPAQVDAAGEALEVSKTITVNGESVTVKATVEVVPYVAKCAHCDQEVTWTAWTATENLPADDQENGHYYLATDVQIPNVQRQLRGNKEIILNLNGHTVSNFPGTRVYGMSGDNNHLHIMDTSEGAKGKIVITGNFTTNPSALCYLGSNNSSFNLYSGTVDGSAAKCQEAGVILRVRAKTEFNMYGGTIIGGTVTDRTDGTTLATYGGAISINGTMTMTGGTIKGGIAKSDAPSNTSAGIGGNICIRNNGKLTMSGGTIEGGSSNFGGWNVDVQAGGTFEFSGGTVKGGSNTDANAVGGNVYCQPAPDDGSKAAGALVWTGDGTIEGQTKP